ncbi:Protease [Arthrobotrys entomopaga]|nr:Protease [Arthrobotrys entomopaga]
MTSRSEESGIPARYTYVVPIPERDSELWKTLGRMVARLLVLVDDGLAIRQEYVAILDEYVVKSGISEASLRSYKAAAVKDIAEVKNKTEPERRNYANILIKQAEDHFQIVPNPEYVRFVAEQAAIGRRHDRSASRTHRSLTPDRRSQRRSPDHRSAISRSRSRERSRETYRGRSRRRYRSPSSYTMASERITALTKLPTSIKTKDIPKYDGLKTTIEEYDSVIRSFCKAHGCPVYYGGYVEGDDDAGFRYCSKEAGARLNFGLGTKFCAAAVSNFEDPVKSCWLEYESVEDDDHPYPNCWKRHNTRPGSEYDAAVARREVSLYDLVMKWSNPKLVKKQAAQEISRMTFDPYTGTSSEFQAKCNKLLRQAGYTDEYERTTKIRDMLPKWMKSKIQADDDEEVFWNQFHKLVLTIQHDKLYERERNGDDKKHKDKICRNCGEKGHIELNCPKKGTKVKLFGTDASASPGSNRSNTEDADCCDFCGMKGHTGRTCRRMAAAAKAAKEEVANKKGNAGGTNNGSGNGSGGNHRYSGSSGGGYGGKKKCYICGSENHLANSCDQKEKRPVHENQRQEPEDKGSGTCAGEGCGEKRKMGSWMIRTEHFKKDKVYDQGHKIDMPMYMALQKPHEPHDVFTMPKEIGGEPEGALWSIEHTVGGQQLYTIQDTGSGDCIIPRSTLNATGDWKVYDSEAEFVVGDSQSWAVLGEVRDFRARVGGTVYQFHVFVVEHAHFQLLLGNRFYHGAGAGLFPRWRKVILTIPAYRELKVQYHLVDSTKLVSPLKLEKRDTGIAHVIRYEPGNAKLIPVTFVHKEKRKVNNFNVKAIIAGEDDLMGKADDPIIPEPEVEVTVDFVKNNVKWGEKVPDDVKDSVVQLFLKYRKAISWHQLDLACIEDVPFDCKPFDVTPVVDAPRPYLYSPVNNEIIRAKTKPLVDMGIYVEAPIDVVDRAQLVIVRKPPKSSVNPKEDRNNPDYCRIAHDFRGKNANIHLDPYPNSQIEELYTFLTKFKIFCALDADRGYNGIPMTEAAQRHYAFEMFKKLWVSKRLMFGPINGPAVFHRNTDIMLGDMKGDEWFNFFDDLFSGGNDWIQLLNHTERLLIRAIVKGWKFKLRKTKWGFEQIVSCGVLYSKNGTKMHPDTVDALQNFKVPTTATELKSFLGTANQFIDRIPGYALHIPMLSKLAGLKGKIIMGPEHLVEFDRVKEFLKDPCVLRRYIQGLPTKVYSDASKGSQDGLTPGGLGGVITQIHDDGLEYVVAYASTRLTSAQKNYPIPRLEVCSFVFMCGKFAHMLRNTEFTWINDSRASSYIKTARTSTNPAIANYALTLSEYHYTPVWTSGLKMIADSLSRLVVMPAEADVAITMKEMVFGRVGSGLPTESYTEVVEKLNNGVYMMARIPSQYIPVFEATRSNSDVRMSIAKLDTPLVPLPVAEDAAEKVDLTRHDKIKLRSLEFLRPWIVNHELGTPNKVLVRCIKRIARGVSYEGGLLVKKSKSWGTVEVIDDIDKMRSIMTEMHDNFGHRGFQSVYTLFRKRYWMPCSDKLIKMHISACKACNRFAKSDTIAAPGYSPRAEDVFAHWNVDHAGPFPKDAVTGCEYVILVVCQLSRWAEAAQVPDTSAVTTANWLYTNIICRYGSPISITSDMGPAFANQVIEQLCARMQSEKRFSTPYYPQSNGRVERLVQTLKSSIKKGISNFIQEEGAELVHWEPALSTALWAYRATPHKVTGCSPSFLAHGVEQRIPGDVTGKPMEPPTTDEEHKELVAERLRFLSDRLPGLRQDRDLTNTPVGKHIQFKMGDLVWLRNSKFEKGGIIPVFTPRYLGPYEIADVGLRNSYRLRTITSVTGKRSKLTANMVNGTRLRLVTGGLESLKEALAPLDVDDKEDEGYTSD